jgi:hypothetical protein
VSVFQQQLSLLQAAGDNRQAVIELELSLHDQLNSQIGSIIMRLINNSTRVLRRRIVEMLFDTIDIAKHVRFHQELMGKIISEALSGYALMDHYRDYLTELTQPLRLKLQAMPPDPTLLPSPL